MQLHNQFQLPNKKSMSSSASEHACKVKGRKMDENKVEKRLMDWYVTLAANTTSKDKYIETAKKFDKLADWYKGIGDSYQKKVDHYRDLQQMAQNAAAANRKLAEDAE